MKDAAEPQETNNLPEDFKSQITAIVQNLAVFEGKIYRKRGGDMIESTRAIADEMAAFGADRLDVTMLLTYYIYRIYYVDPNEKRDIRESHDEPIENLTYRDIERKGRNYRMSPYWQYAPGVINRKYNSRLVLRRGSQSTWVKNGAYAEYSIKTDDDVPLSRITFPTHTFVQDSPVAIYNWIFGQYRPDNDQSGFVRFYFNLKPHKEAGKALSKEIKRRFNDYEIPFTFKFLAFSQDYDRRADTAVLYIERKHINIASYLIRDIYHYLIRRDPANPFVNSKVSLFVYRLCDGLSFAEDPENNDSFGTSRCRAITLALKAFGGNLNEHDQRVEFVLNNLRDRGYCIENFYKNQFSKFSYETFFKTILTKDAVPWSRPWYFKKDPYLYMAIKVAIRLCKEAIWYQVNEIWHCTWITYSEQKEKLTDDSRLPAMKKNRREPEFGYKYVLLPSGGHEYYSSIGVQRFLRLVDKWTNGSLGILKLTADAIDDKSPIVDPSISKENDWQDDIVSKAWEETFVKQQMSRDERRKLADEINKLFLVQGRPIGNAFPSEDLHRRRLFSPSVRFGLAGIGYFFMLTHDPKVPIPDPDK